MRIKTLRNMIVGGQVVGAGNVVDADGGVGPYLVGRGMAAAVERAVGPAQGDGVERAVAPAQKRGRKPAKKRRGGKKTE